MPKTQPPTPPPEQSAISIEDLVERALTKQSEQDLNEQQLNLLRLCRLLVKIEYRHKYGNPTEGAQDGL